MQKGAGTKFVPTTDYLTRRGSSDRGRACPGTFRRDKSLQLLVSYLRILYACDLFVATRTGQLRNLKEKIDFCEKRCSHQLTSHLFCLIRFRAMERNGYEKISADDGDANHVDIVSFLFFQWMNHVIRTGSKRALELNDFLPLSQENLTSSVTEKLQTKWNDERAKCKRSGKRPKFWKSVLKMISVKDVLTIMFTGVLDSCCRIFQPLFLGYLISSLMSTTESRNDFLLYGCAVAMGVNALIKSLGMQHFSFRNELLGVRLTSAIKGIVYGKVCVVLSYPLHSLNQFLALF